MYVTKYNGKRIDKSKMNIEEERAPRLLEMDCEMGTRVEYKVLRGMAREVDLLT